MARRLRLIKVRVQPVLVIDDGDAITELDHPPVVIPAADWPRYSAETFPSDIAKWQAEIDAEDAPPKANREARRKATRARAKAGPKAAKG